MFYIDNILSLTDNISSLFCKKFEKIMLRLNLPVLFAQKGLRVADAERDTDISRTTLYRMYNNESSRVDLDILETLCLYLDCEPKDIFIFEKPTDDSKK